MYNNDPMDRILMMTGTNGSTPSLPLTVNGIPVNALFDTGSSVSTISMDTLKQLGIADYVDPTGGILLRPAIGHVFKAIGSISVRTGALGQQLMVVAQVFKDNPSYFDVILGWPEFQASMKIASLQNPAYGVLLDALSPHTHIPATQKTLTLGYMNTTLLSLTNNVPLTESNDASKEATVEQKLPNNKATQESDRFPDTYICPFGKIHNSLYEHKAHLSSCIYVAGHPLGFQCTCKRIFFDKQK